MQLQVRDTTSQRGTLILNSSVMNIKNDDINLVKNSVSTTGISVEVANFTTGPLLLEPKKSGVLGLNYKKFTATTNNFITNEPFIASTDAKLWDGDSSTTIQLYDNGEQFEGNEPVSLTEDTELALLIGVESGGQGQAEPLNFTFRKGPVLDLTQLSTTISDTNSPSLNGSTLTFQQNDPVTYFALHQTADSLTNMTGRTIEFSKINGPEWLLVMTEQIGGGYHLKCETSRTLTNDDVTDGVTLDIKCLETTYER